MRENIFYEENSLYGENKEVGVQIVKLSKVYGRE